MGHSVPYLIWKGRTLRTHREVFDGFTACADDAERRRFVQQASSVNPHAIGNIRYMAGYCDNKTMQCILNDLDRATESYVPS